MSVTVNEFLDRLESSGILDDVELDVVRTGAPGDGGDAKRFAKSLHKSGRLTGYQVQALWRGKGHKLVVGNYVIEDELGRGGMGVVLKARHRRMQRHVAIKVLPKAMTEDPAAIARFQREVVAAAQLSHPNIVAAHDADEIDGQHILVMEFVDGRDLASVVKKQGPLSVEQALDCTMQAARGLEFAHMKGIVHRDVKPANLLLDSEGTVKILDMGLARFDESADVGTQAELTGTGTIMGTVDYMSPEQSMSTKSADARSDVYSLGMTLWFLLTGRPCYTGDSLMARMMAHANADIPSLQTWRPEIPDDVQAVFERMVAKSVDDRYQSMTEVIADLEACRSGASVTSGLIATANAANLNHGLTGVFDERGATDGDGLAATSSFARHTAPGEPTREAPPSQAEAATFVSSSAVADTEETLPPSIEIDTGEDSSPTLRSRKKPRKRKKSKSSDSPSSTPATLVERARTIPWTDKRVLAGLGGALVLLLGAIVLLFRGPDGTTLRIEITDPEIEVRVKGTKIVLKGADVKKRDIIIDPGDHTLHITRGDFAFDTDTLTLKKGDTVVVRAEIMNGVPRAIRDGKVIGEPATPEGPGSSGEYALEFDGRSNVWIGDVEWGDSEVRTYEAFVRCDSFGDRARVVNHHNSASLWDDNGRWGFGIHTDDTIMAVHDSRGIVPGRWYHIAGVVRNEQIELFVDGEPSGTKKPSSAVHVRPGLSLGDDLSGAIRGVRVSKSDRYRGKFTPPLRFETDADTICLYDFAEGEGDVLKDSSGNGHHGKILGAKWVRGDGAATNVSTPSGFALDFNAHAKAPGTDSVVVPTLIEDGSVQTIELWTKRRLVTGPNGHLSIAGFDSSFALGTSEADDFRFAFRCPVRNAQPIWSVDATTGLDGPVHLAGVRDLAAREFRFYLNGELVGRQPFGELLDRRQPFRFCVQGYQPELRLYSGWIDEVRLSTTPRYSGNFTPSSRFEPDEHTVALYHFDEGSGAVLKDSSGNGHHGKIVGAKWVRVRPDDSTAAASETPAENLLDTVDLGRDVVRGTWQLRDGKLSCHHVRGVAPPAAVLEFSTVPSDSYRLDLGFIRREGDQSCTVQIPIGNRGVTFILDGFLEKSLTGLQQLDGVGLSMSPAAVTGPRVRTGERQFLRIEVDTDGTTARITARLDGEKIFHWSGESDRLSPSPFHEFRKADRVSLAVQHSHFEFDSVQLYDRTPVAPPPAVAPYDASAAKAHQEAWAKHLGEPVVTTNSIGTKFAVIPPGEFKMGEGDGAVDVALTRPFRLGIHEVTQREWTAVMGTEPWKGQKETLVGDDVAATFIGWPDATEFCRTLTQRERTAGSLPEGWEYRLPTQAEWEFALRAGTTGEWSFTDGGKTIGDYGWFDENAKKVGEAHAHVVGRKEPTPWGLYDMHGNVWEWCSDWNTNDPQGGRDPRGPSQGSARAHRGGSWNDGAWYARSPVRHGAHEAARDPYRGFRLVLAPVAGARIGEIGSSVPKTYGDAPPRAVAPFDAAKAKFHQEAWAKYLGVPVEREVDLGGGESVTLVLIPPGEYMMGATDAEIERFVEQLVPPFIDRCRAEAPRHRVRITRPFRMSREEITRGEFRRFVEAARFVTDAERDGLGGAGLDSEAESGWVKDPRFNWKSDLGFPQDDRHPVVNVSWNDARGFVAWFSRESGLACNLPTCAQWEYACRSGTTTIWSHGEDETELPTFAWTQSKPVGTQPVGTRLPNAFGLHDMHGSVFEWTQDWSDMAYYGNSPTDDPTGPDSGKNREFRGGSWMHPAVLCRSSMRSYARPDARNYFLGFRVVTAVESPDAPSTPDTRMGATPVRGRSLHADGGFPVVANIDGRGN